MTAATATVDERHMVTEEGYVSAEDGTRLYWRSEGRGPRTLFCLNGIGVSTFFWDPTVAYFRDRFRVVVWDYRAHGKSDLGPSPESCTVRTCARDALAVMDALGVEKAAILGHSMGSQVSLELYREAPERVLALVPTLGTWRNALSTFFDSPRLSKVLFEIGNLFGSNIPRATSLLTRAFVMSPLAWTSMKMLGVVHPDLMPHERMVPYLEHLGRLELKSYFALCKDIEKHDASDVLPDIAVPTLVVGAERDLFTPARLSREMASLIPGAELFVITAGSHAAIVEQPELYCLRLEKFFEERKVFAGPAAKR